MLDLSDFDGSIEEDNPSENNEKVETSNMNRRSDEGHANSKSFLQQSYMNLQNHQTKMRGDPQHHDEVYQTSQSMNLT